MTTEQRLWQKSTGWVITKESSNSKESSLAFVFGGIDVINSSAISDELKARYPKAQIIYCSTAGEIHASSVFDESISVTACVFEKTETKVICINVADSKDSFECGQELGRQLAADDLRHVFILSDGTSVNGDYLVSGVNSELPNDVVVTGGLAGDAGRFSKTFVGLNEITDGDKIVAVGFYGEHIHVTHGSQGGWDLFGPVRQVTKSADNVLYELDGENALEIYKRYLGVRAADLPGSALLFPLCILNEASEMQLVRTILAIDETQGSMTFAGNIPEGSNVQFMMANFDRLIDGAGIAAEESKQKELSKPELVVMISCVGRKLVLDQRVEEEVESVTGVYGSGPAYTGFYSNGEISPLLNKVGCSLHNQTMTITTYSEK